MKNSNDTLGNRTRDIPTFSAVPQPTALPWGSQNEVGGRKIKGEKLQKQQDRQYTYNLKLRRVRATVVVVEKQEILHILSLCLQS